MSIDQKFLAASKAAEDWVNIVSLISKLGGEWDKADVAERLLWPRKDGPRYNLQTSVNVHAETLDRMKEQLADVSEGGPVKWGQGRGWSAIAPEPNAVRPPIWSSAHEAAAGIARLALEISAWPMPARWKGLAMSPDEVATLQWRIRRERAKVVKVNSEPPAAELQPAPPSGETPPKQKPVPGGEGVDPILTLLPGAFTFRGHKQKLRGKPRLVLEELWRARGRTLTLKALQDTVWKDSITGEETIRSAISDLRGALRTAITSVQGNCDFDPVELVERGQGLTAWQLNLR